MRDNLVPLGAADGEEAVDATPQRASAHVGAGVMSQPDGDRLCRFASERNEAPAAKWSSMVLAEAAAYSRSHLDCRCILILIVAEQGPHAVYPRMYCARRSESEPFAG